jgi:hypothetical protein
MSETRMVIDPRMECTRIAAWSTATPRRRLMSAELLAQPSHPRAVQWLIEAIALWQGSPVHAVLVARERDATYVTRLYPDWFTDFGSALYTLELVDERGLRGRRRERVAAGAR